MTACKHVRQGIVTNQPDGYDPKRPHASITSCVRPGCMKAAKSWVASQTNETAYFVPDRDRTVRL